ncbi:MAG: FAD-dependent oxidoreductase, partial [Rhodoferax sp.]|nr:FAD-dependent oxidoreductase [Rhodoferax sp.]
MNSGLLIVGGGIGGLAAALACGRQGVPVQLFERSAEFSELGAGVQLGPNVVRRLQGWGLMPALHEVVSLPDALQVRSARSGALLGRIELGQRAQERYGAPYATVHRGDLHRLLLAAAQQQAGVELRRGARIDGVAVEGDGVRLQMAEGGSATGRLALGADGVWSRVRRGLLADGDPQPTGHMAYRALLPQADLPPALRATGVDLWLGPDLHAVAYPVRRGTWLNLVVIVAGRAQGDLQGWDHAGVSDAVRQVLSGSTARLRDLAAAVSSWRLWHLQARPPVQGPGQMAQGRIALLGDAAHPMLPYLAQGAGMAIEDAHALGLCLADQGLAPAALGH